MSPVSKLPQQIVNCAAWIAAGLIWAYSFIWVKKSRRSLTLAYGKWIQNSYSYVIFLNTISVNASLFIHWFITTIKRDLCCMWKLSFGWHGCTLQDGFWWVTDSCVDWCFSGPASPGMKRKRPRPCHRRDEWVVVPSFGEACFLGSIAVWAWVWCHQWRPCQS